MEPSTHSLMRLMRVRSLYIAVALPLAAAHAQQDWPSYGGDPGGERHSPLAQITRANVSRLTVAWRFRTGEAIGTLKTVDQELYELARSFFS